MQDWAEAASPQATRTRSTANAILEADSPFKQLQSCPNCGSVRIRRDGRRRGTRGSVQRWLCRDCPHRFTLQPKKNRSEGRQLCAISKGESRNLALVETKGQNATGDLATAPEEIKGMILCIRYLDHVLFKNADPRDLAPCVREAVGWFVNETEDYLALTFDRTVNPMVNEVLCKESGLVILKSNILERKQIGEK